VVDIRHDNGITTRYAHMSAMEVKEGERVAVGRLIGRVGTSGRSTGPHLHYETRVNGKPIDPYEFLRVARNVLQEKSK
jgi:murein DD-endopeptidase MepM/ murein hydrolase activator NlpD